MSWMLPPWPDLSSSAGSFQQKTRKKNWPFMTSFYFINPACLLRCFYPLQYRQKLPARTDPKRLKLGKRLQEVGLKFATTHH